MNDRFPMQPIHRDNGVLRFQGNPIVEFLREFCRIHGLDMNDLVLASDKNGFKQRDWEQFYQLIGYSLAGFHELDKVSDVTAKLASAEARKQLRLPPNYLVGCRDTGCEIHCGVERERE